MQPEALLYFRYRLGLPEEIIKHIEDFCYTEFNNCKEWRVIVPLCYDCNFKPLSYTHPVAHRWFGPAVIEYTDVLGKPAIGRGWWALHRKKIGTQIVHRYWFYGNEYKQYIFFNIKEEDTMCQAGVLQKSFHFEVENYKESLLQPHFIDWVKENQTLLSTRSTSCIKRKAGRSYYEFLRPIKRERYEDY